MDNKEERLRELYKQYLTFQKQNFVNDAPFFYGNEKIKADKSSCSLVYDKNYEKPFLSFVRDLRNILSYSNIFSLIAQGSYDWYDLLIYSEFFKHSSAIHVARTGKVFLPQKSFLDIIPGLLHRKEIIKRIERKLKTTIHRNKPVTKLFEKIAPFYPKPQFDQLPLSQSSAIFVTTKILQNLPLKKKFLIVGDDDFISVFLTLVDPKIEVVVVDVDEELLRNIRRLADIFNLLIETRTLDIRKERTIKDKGFVGFSCNPPNTEGGMRTFINFGIRHLGESGGIAVLEMGDGTLGRKSLYLQNFFAKRKLVIREMIRGKITYPHMALLKEDLWAKKRLRKLFDVKTIEKEPWLGSSLYVFDYVPGAKKRPVVVNGESIYSYL